MTITIAMVISAFGKRIIAEEIFLDSLPQAFEGFRILFITDIHRRLLPQALMLSLKGHVDAVFLGGDITEKNNPMNRLLSNMALVTSIAPTYAVHGNHDYNANTSVVDNIIRKSGAVLLVDENVAIERAGGTLWLTGVDFMVKRGKSAYPPLPPLAVSDTACRIILVHDPVWLSQRSSVPADLVLAGHTHGGQVVFPFFGRRHVETFYQEYDAGWFILPKGDESKTFAKLLISRGFGTAHLPLRFRSPAEIHVLTLRNSTSKGESQSQ
ncbi:metallophosphoesterase [Paenibacillus monticola]|nr:metallophosphoesterase [Paenibacillus monticola]